MIAVALLAIGGAAALGLLVVWVVARPTPECAWPGCHEAGAWASLDAGPGGLCDRHAAVELGAVR